MLTYLSTLRSKAGFFLVRPEKCVFCRFVQHVPSPSLRFGELRKATPRPAFDDGQRKAERQKGRKAERQKGRKAKIRYWCSQRRFLAVRVVLGIGMKRTLPKRTRALAFTRRGGRSPERAQRGKEAPAAQDACPRHAKEVEDLSWGVFRGECRGGLGGAQPLTDSLCRAPRRRPKLRRAAKLSARRAANLSADSGVGIAARRAGAPP